MLNSILRLIHSALYSKLKALPQGAPTTVTGGASSYANAAYTQLLAAASNTAKKRIVAIVVHAATADDHELDIAIGAASSESIILTVKFTGAGRISIPGSPLIAASTRIAARARSAAGSIDPTISIAYQE